MTNDTWVLLQFCVASCTGLVMWGLVRLVATTWNKARSIAFERRREAMRGSAGIPFKGR